MGAKLQHGIIDERQARAMGTHDAGTRTSSNTNFAWTSKPISGVFRRGLFTVGG
jgi:hypothetical protein